MRRWLVLLCWLMFASVVAAQDSDLIAENVEVMRRLDTYGLEQPFAVGALLNSGEMAYGNISLSAEVYDSDGSVVGEGFGYLVNACGEALLNDFALQSGRRETFAVPLDLYEADSEIDHVDILPEGDAADPAPASDLPAMPAVMQVTDREVVEVEWIDGDSLRYSAGCWRDVFTNRDWYEYDLTTGAQEPVIHPRAENVTNSLKKSIKLDDPAVFDRSFFTFAPGGRRAVYQTDLNTLVTVEPDGTFPRVLYDSLFNISLQGINWYKTSGTFLAYYHGGYGDEVTYLVANADGRQFSQHPNASLPSEIVPGFAVNGRGVVIATTIDGVRGYFLKSTTTDFVILMFETEPPGNNWPAPFYEITLDGQRWIYIVRPVEGVARLQCYNPDSQQLHDYTALPLDLATDERGWLWLSPDDHALALAANGIKGGLWTIDLTAFAACD